MEEIIKLIGDYGILIILAAVFIFRTLKTDKTNTELLHQINADHKTNNETVSILRQESTNTQTALSIIQNTLASHTLALDRHDGRAENINEKLREALTLLQTELKQHEETKIQ